MIFVSETTLPDPETYFSTNSKPTYSEVALRYLSYWTLCLTFGRADFDLGLTLDLCEALCAILADDLCFASVFPSDLELTVRRIYRYLLDQMNSMDGPEYERKIPGFMLPWTVELLNKLTRGLMVRP